MFIGSAKIAVDISALGIKPPAEQDQSISGWLGLNTDGMMPGRISTAAELPTSLPVGVGTQNPLAAHEESFCRGFELQAQALTELKERWLAPGGGTRWFCGIDPAHRAQGHPGVFRPATAPAGTSRLAFQPGPGLKPGATGSQLPDGGEQTTALASFCC